MGLLTETNAQYYAGQQTFTAVGDIVPPYETFTWTGNTTLSDVSGSVPANYTVTINGVLAAPVPTVSNNVVELGQTTTAGDKVVITLSQTAINNNYGSYEYISLHDVINNFIVAYVGKDKIIPDIKRTDVMFHAKRLTVPPSLSVVIPQDYVNYVKCSWVDDVGAKHIVYPTRVTSNPTELPIQDAAGIPTQDSLGDNTEANQSVTEQRWAEQNNTAYDGFDDYRYPEAEFVFGQRYGLEPEEAQINGKFTINERLGKMSFAEEAIYMHIAHAVLSVRSNIPEYVINRFKKDRRAALRNAKIRLSNIKIEEIAQVFRNKSKIIKH